MIIVQDLALQIGLANYKVRQQFTRELAGRTLSNEIRVMPLSLITVENLEKVIPYLGDFVFTQILDQYVSPKHEPLYTFENALATFIRENGVAHRDNQWILQRRSELNKLIKDELNLQ